MKRFFRDNTVNFRKFNTPVSGYDPGKVDNSRALLDSFDFLTVKARPNESSEYLVKRFRRCIEDSGILGEIKKREFFKSRGQKEREKKMKSQKRLAKLRAKQLEMDKFDR